MKKWLYGLFLPLAGCQVVDETKEAFENAPPEVWTAIKDVVVWFLTTFYEIALAWFIAIFQ